MPEGEKSGGGYVESEVRTYKAMDSFRGYRRGLPARPTLTLTIDAEKLYVPQYASTFWVFSFRFFVCGAREILAHPVGEKNSCWLCVGSSSH